MSPYARYRRARGMLGGLRPVRPTVRGTRLNEGEGIARFERPPGRHRRRHRPARGRAGRRRRRVDQMPVRRRRRQARRPVMTSRGRSAVGVSRQPGLRHRRRQQGDRFQPEPVPRERGDLGGWHERQPLRQHRESRTRPLEPLADGPDEPTGLLGDEPRYRRMRVRLRVQRRGRLIRRRRRGVLEPRPVGDSGRQPVVARHRDVEQLARDVTLNVAALSGAVEYLGSVVHVASLGFYSTSYQWGVITGGTSAFSGYPSWVAGASDAAGANANCAGPGFTGGGVALAQYVSGGFDADVRCSPSTGAVVDRRVAGDGLGRGRRVGAVRRHGLRPVRPADGDATHHDLVCQRRRDDRRERPLHRRIDRRWAAHGQRIQRGCHRDGKGHGHERAGLLVVGEPERRSRSAAAARRPTGHASPRSAASRAASR